MEKLNEIPHIIKIVIESFPKTTFLYCGLLTIEQQSLGIDITYTYHGNEMDKYKKSHHKINIAILTALSEMGVEIGIFFHSCSFFFKLSL